VSIKKIRLTAAFLLFVIYIPGVVSTGIWSDDYSALFDPHAVQIHASRDGRPLYGFAIQLIFNLFDSVNSLWLIRLLALIGLILLNDLVIKVLCNSEFDVRKVVSSIGAFSIAGFQVNVHWATTFLFCWVAYFSLLGFTLLVKESYKNKCIGILLLTASSLSYPLLTFFILPIVFLNWYEGGGKFRILKWNLYWFFFGIFFAAFFSLLINNFSLRARGLDLNDRFSFISVSDLPGQISWFLSRPFVLAFRGFTIYSPGGVEALLGLLVVNSLILIGFFLKYSSFVKSIKAHLLFLFFTIASMTPLFFPDQQQIDVRYVTVGSWLASYMLITSIVLIFERIFRGKGRVWSNSFAVVLLLLFFLSINSRFVSVIKPIYSETKSFVSRELDDCEDLQIIKGVFVLPRTIEWPKKPYIGLFSQITDLESSWVPLPAVRIAIQDNPTFQNFSIPVSWGNPGSKGCLVDLNEFKKKEH